MAIPLAAVLGLTCVFYIYVAIHWWREARLLRRERRQAAPAVLLFASARDHSPAGVGFQARETRSCGPRSGQTEFGRREVIEMAEAKAGRNRKDVVAQERLK